VDFKKVIKMWLMIFELNRQPDQEKQMESSSRQGSGELAKNFTSNANKIIICDLPLHPVYPNV
jgi:hypothetical protein